MSDRWCLDGRVAIVTGGGRGLGEGCAVRSRVAGAVRAGIMAAADDLGDVRVLVNSAGTNRVGPAADYPLSDWDALFDLNVRATFVLTPLTGPMFADDEFTAEVGRRIPTGELATVEQVADAVRYLACDASSSVTGSVLRIDGGWTAW